MKRNLFAGKRRSDGVRFEVFTEDELTDIHLGTLEVLERTGVYVEDEEARAVFAGAGRRGRLGDGRRSHPAARRRASHSHGALQGHPRRTEPEARHRPRARPRRLHQLRRGRARSSIPRPASCASPLKQDVADTAKVVDYLPNVDVYERAVAAHDVSQASAPLHQAEAWMTNTSKHGFMGSGNGYLSTSSSTWPPRSSGGGRSFARARSSRSSLAPSAR